jgi:hypothetical protein
MTDEIDRYLDRLLLELSGRATDARRIVTEAEEHLRQAVEEGASPEEAIARFGRPAQIARRFDPPRLALAPLVTATWHLFAVGLLAIGASGLLSIGARAGWGSQFVAGDPPDVTYTAARCADFEEYHPEVATCRAAAGAHHADEVELYRVAAGVLGAVTLGAWQLRRRRRPPPPRSAVDELAPAVGATMFAAAGLALAAQGLSLLTQGTHAGAGQWLTGAVVSLAVAAAYATQVRRGLRLRAA